jgi:osmotically-inducible protein OsmY
MKNLLRFIAFILMVGSAYAQSTLPDCLGSAIWGNCSGTFTYSNGDRYVGEYKNRQQNGQGTYTYANGDKYVGEWKDGMRNGQGTLSASNGSVTSQGIWADNKFVRSEKIQQSITSIVVPNNVDQDRRSAGIKLEDESIELRIAQSLRRNVSASGHINVTSYNRVVLLTGEVGSSAEKERADRLAKSQENVSAVVNELAIEPASSLTQRSKDIITTAQIKAFMVNEKDLQANAFKVVVDRGIVYLMGRVTTREAQRASEIALSGRVSSVVKVVRVFEIITEQELSNVSSRINYVASPERSERQDLDQQIAAEKDRERITADLDAERKKRQELEEQLRVAQQSTQPNKPAVTTGIERRVALVVGNGNYKIRPLKNSKNDADDVSRSLKATGFEVIDLRDATLPQMRTAVRQFGDRLVNNDVGLVYYSGHGVEVKGRNYFIPVNADIQREDEIADQGLDVSLILEKMSTAGKGVNILIVDACRDDPFGRSFRSSSQGLAQMDAPRGTIIAYATSPGKVASDGDPRERNSPYTKHLVKAMQSPNKPIEQVFKEVRRAVQDETKNQQTPWENTSLSGDFFFRVLR